MATDALSGILDAFAQAGVRFVVVGSQEDGLVMAVSRHPTNLGLLGSVLESVGARLRAESTRSVAGPMRAFDSFGTVWISTRYGDLTLLFGNPGESVYSTAFDSSSEREIGGQMVHWVESVSEPRPSSRSASRGQILGQRLLSLVDMLSDHLGHQSPPVESDESAHDE